MGEAGFGRRPMICACTDGPLWAGGGTRLLGDTLGTVVGTRAAWTTEPRGG